MDTKKWYTTKIVELCKDENGAHTNTYTRSEERFTRPSYSGIVMECERRMEYEQVISVSYGLIEEELELSTGTLFK